jgi:hypothetical protein
VVHYQILPKTELQTRFQMFKKNCEDILHSIRLRNFLVSHLKTSLSFLEDALYKDESFGEPMSVQHRPESANNGKGAYVLEAGTALSEDEDDLDQSGTESELLPPEDFVTHDSHDSALDPGNVWDSSWDNEFDSLLGQQFLDPSWLEDSWLE